MTHADRIDELEKKFDENPRRYFAPLANEYRKAGDLAKAIEICRSHLPQQPGHMSGHIVYGQALYESRRLEEAKAVFEAALGLDPENLIALRHLGDIARDSGDSQTARVWYLRVLDADPRNDEVAGMLAELDAAATAAVSAPGAPESSVGWGDINPERGAGPGDAGAAASEAEGEGFTVEHASAHGDDFLASLTAAPEPAAAPAPADEDPLAQDPMWDTGADQIPERASRPTPVAPIQSAPPRPAPPPPPPPQKLPARAEPDLDDRTFAEVDALFDEIATPESTAQVPSRATAAPAREPAPADRPSVSAEVPGLESAEFQPPPRDPAPRVAAGSVPGLTSFGAATNQDSATPAFVTETMAELYLQQGFNAEALEIYQRLLAQNPNDSSLRDRVDQLQSGGRSSMSVTAVSSEIIEAARQRRDVRPVRTIRSFFGLLAGRRAPPQDAQPGAPVSRTGSAEFAAVPPQRRSAPPPSQGLGGLFGGGVSVQDEEAAMLLASAFGPSPGDPEHDAGSGAAAAGRPTRTAGEELSLDDVFRESSSRGHQKSGAYSFDEFFSPGSEQAAARRSREDGGGDDDGPPEEDLEQFTAWLEGLKRK